MTIHTEQLDQLIDRIPQQLESRELAPITAELTELSSPDLVVVFEHLSVQHRAMAHRLLPKDRALEVFEALDPALQSDLLTALQAPEVAQLFAELDPDDRMWLLDEVPAALAARLLSGLPAEERALTAGLLGYPQDSVGRRMTPEMVSTHVGTTVAATMQRVRDRLADAETIYTIPVLDHGRKVVGVISLRDLLGATDDTLVEHLMQAPHTAEATLDAEHAARLCVDLRLLAMPIVDSENRLVGMLTIDDAARIVEIEENEDSARQGGVEPLNRPYLSTPVFTIVRSRVVWLLVLALGAALTVQVLSAFEATIEQVTALALFVPLLIGTGGNTGNQAATTVTRALALGDVRPRDLARVLGKEVRTGAMLGLLLGCMGFGITAVFFSPDIGVVIGLTLLAVCTVAASVGGVMPLAARAIKVDPAVFSNPFITTFVDATGLIIYFLIARTVLQL
ncbi:magnesium transporter [Leucobacter insecticola]|uniref:Magnesium transporter MgtE n=1 Tax=Leucobacter insecticola TaxID=2714934 RepID=A0A6G8FKB2_9MICO|nr:magnesium transporter [Leucobacter insecticola]QIM16733.1 magnesium transporter [Leucobacter insecticola]